MSTLEKTMAVLEKTKAALEKNNMLCHIVNTGAEAKELCEKILKEGATVASGGSMSLIECGVMELLRSGKYNYIDRETFQDKREAYLKSFSSDFYLCSSNAVTEDGVLYNVDGNGNRVACICYGPSNVILLVGKNKIVKDINEAQKRIKETAAPLNCRRLNCETYCNKKGECMGISGALSDGCAADSRICCQYVATGFQRIKNRICVILINEDYGF